MCSRVLTNHALCVAFMVKLQPKVQCRGDSVSLSGELVNLGSSGSPCSYTQLVYSGLVLLRCSWFLEVLQSC